MSSTADYDAPRRPAVELDDPGLGELLPRTTSQSPGAGLDEADATEAVDVPGAETVDEDLTAPVVPMRADEFRCVRCFLVRHRSQLAGRHGDGEICEDCA